ncbi:hypothetical protein P152DRAFT_459532 [Eremomyces bilateralis CBS 781.70]|uniref:LYR motif-containing protein Cup1-like N-terminal domain-containing protein n=1 Tax=Eremomyces bilateralis CBS 781.70 TaxID=1392243 RepID=A0A6G1G0G0_9PEZI|nr:uncharacterized protein P152DRAFT_459532 [Eremomyces bilateralis CBS 781.70]KAF1811595.1 hypothetical protein P152DRAFT_459532 [Eremomyces bilateralis CBS 781.70]
MERIRSKYGPITRHLLRAILRESTYLPDPSARAYCRQHALERFRNGRENIREAVYICRKKKSSPEEWVDPVLLRRLHTGHHALERLQNANHGKLSVLTTIILETYGRTGKPRRQLINTLVQPDHDLSDASSGDGDAPPLEPPLPGLESIPAQLWGTRTVDKQHITYTISPRYSRLRDLARSQAQHTFNGRRQRRTLRSTKLAIPSTNMWLQPMPRKREQNAIYKLYAEFLHKLEAPLPESEWERLRDLASGKVPWEGPRPRRASPEGLPVVFDRQKLYEMVKGANALKAETADGEEHSSEDNSEILEKTVSRYLERIVLARPLNHLGAWVPPSRLDARTMRRIWAYTFSLCPLMKWNEAGKNWDVQWGSQAQTVSVPHASPEEIGG